MIIGPGAATRVWAFTKDGRSASVRVAGRVTTAANEGATAAAVAGLGIAQMSVWACRAELERGALEPVLGDWTMEPVEVHAVFPVGRAAAPAARVFVDYLSTELRSGRGP